VPLSERMFNYQQKAEAEDRQAEAKMWSVLIGQIWSGLSGYCIGTPKLKQVKGSSYSFPFVFSSNYF